LDNTFICITFESNFTHMTKIKLNSEVVVSDPCYDIPTWCHAIVNNVLPGYYQPFMKKHDAGNWGTRNSMLMVIHEDHQFEDSFEWEEYPATIGVDSGQAGIFSRETYRNDNHPIEKGEADFDYGKDKEGDAWYMKMCQRTLGVIHWGVYDEGVVCSSGFGDGSYQLFVAKNDEGQIVAMCIDFGVEEEKFIDFEFYKDPINV